MFAGHIPEPRTIRLIDIPEPELGPRPSDPEAMGEILFQPELGCLCGSDLPYFEGQSPEFPCEVGQSLHEIIGRVVATNGTRHRPGDRVLCVPVSHLGLFERFRVSQHRAIPIDPRATDDEALLAQPLGTVLCAMRKLPNILNWNVVVVGQGPMGQLFNAVLSRLGAREIIAVDRIPERLAVSRKMGATAVVDARSEDPVLAVKEQTDGKMADLVVEVVGHKDQVFNLCIDLCRDFGHILFFGVPPTTIDGLHWRRLFWRNIGVTTSLGPDFTIDFPLAMRWVAERRIDVTPLVTHRFPVSKIQEAFETFVDRRDGAIKVLVDFPRD
ncbi:MAG: zinc-binding dehydrogenase [Planctomycetes bacterium]|nr:zinc-binding dehydrogenase [Planctomycetota bacterium]